MDTHKNIFYLWQAQALIIWDLKSLVKKKNLLQNRWTWLNQRGARTWVWTFEISKDPNFLSAEREILAL